MAIVVPGVHYRQLRGKSTTPLQPRFINLHTMVGTLAGTESWFSPSGRPYSHFGAGGSGVLRQWQDLRFRAASDLQGNPYSISIECEDMGSHFPGWSGSNVPQFTEAQLASLVVLVAWLCARFGLPPSAIRSSCTDQRGVGWHRFGIDPWRQTNCPRWSSSAGKACPGDRRIAQIQNRLLPALGSPPSPPPGDDDMAVTDDDLRKMQSMFRAVLNEGAGSDQKNWAGQERGTASHVRKIRTAVDEIPTGNEFVSLVRSGLNEGAMDGQTNWASQERGTASHLRKIRATVDSLAEQVAEIRAKLDELT